MKQLFVIRHAIAADASSGADDGARALTREGRQRFEESVRGLAKLGTRLDLVVHSPLLRAVQTAELLRPLLAGGTAVSAHLTAAPNAELLRELAGESVAVVGHEPWLSELVAWLVTSNRALGPSFALEKGAVVLLEGDLTPGKSSLAAFLTPRVLRGLDR